MKKHLAVVVGLGLFSACAFAGTTGAEFEELYQLVHDWATGFRSSHCLDLPVGGSWYGRTQRFNSGSNRLYCRRDGFIDCSERCRRHFDGVDLIQPFLIFKNS